MAAAPTVNPNDNGVGAAATLLTTEFVQEACPIDAELLDYMERLEFHRLAANESTKNVVLAVRAPDTRADRYYWTRVFLQRVLQGQATWRDLARAKFNHHPQRLYSAEEEWAMGFEHRSALLYDIANGARAVHVPGSRNPFQTLHPDPPFRRARIMDAGEDPLFSEGWVKTMFSDVWEKAIDPEPDAAPALDSGEAILSAMLAVFRDTYQQPLNTDYLVDPEDPPLTNEQWDALERARVHTANLGMAGPGFQVKHLGFAVIFRHVDTGAWTTHVFKTTRSLSGGCRAGDLLEFDHISGSCDATEGEGEVAKSPMVKSAEKQ